MKYHFSTNLKHTEKSNYATIPLMFDINPFLTNVPVLHPLKAPENQRPSDVSRWNRMGAFARKWTKNLENNYVS